MEQQLFNHYLIFSSIILGLGVTKLLQNVGQLIKTNSNNIGEHFWPLYVWIVFIFFAQMQYWWAEYIDRDMVPSNFFLTVVNILFPVGLYLMVEILMPDCQSERTYNLKTHYFENKKRIFGLGVVLVVITMFRSFLILDKPPFEDTNLIRILFIITFLYLAFKEHDDKEWLDKLHLWGAVLNLAYLFIFILIYNLYLI